MNSKLCKKCNKIKDLINFRARYTNCRVCEKVWHAKNYQKNKARILKRNAEWRKTHPGKVAEYARNALLRSYGITQKQYDAMLIDQDKRCAICRRADTGRKNSNLFLIDHCHKTRKVRGLLCHKCNVSIGLLRESAVTLRSAIEYLSKSLQSS